MNSEKREKIIRFLRNADLYSFGRDIRAESRNGFLMPDGEFLKTGFALHDFLIEAAFRSAGMDGDSEDFCREFKCVHVSYNNVVNFRLYQSVTEKQFEKMCMFVMKYSDHGYMLTCHDVKSRRFKHQITKHTGVKCVAASDY